MDLRPLGIHSMAHQGYPPSAKREGGFPFSRHRAAEAGASLRKAKEG